MTTHDNRPSNKRRRLRFEHSTALFEEVQRLATAEQNGTLTSLGNWSLGKTMNHLAIWAEYSFTGAPVKVPWIAQKIARMLKPIILSRGMPTGIKIPGVPGGTVGIEEADTAVALGRLKAAMSRLQDESPTKPNMLMGPLKREEWIKLQLRHAELHLGHFQTQS